MFCAFSNRWIDIESSRLRVPTESVHCELDTYKMTPLARESIYDYMAREQPTNLKYVDEVINEVNKVRQIIEMALLTLNIIPVGVLHPLISHYAI
jgi:hypothetical protein